MIADKFKKYILLIMILVVVIAFVSGLIFGYSLSNRNLSTINKMIAENQLNSESYAIEQDLYQDLEQGDCQLVKQRTKDLSDKLAKLGQTLSREDIQNQMNPEEYDFVKRRYHLSQIRTYTFIRKVQKNCNLSSNVILFYYSLKDPVSTEQGKILDQIAKNNDVSIFSVQYQYSSDLAFFEEYYGIKKTPSLIINFDIKKEGLTSYDEIQEMLNNPEK